MLLKVWHFSHSTQKERRHLIFRHSGKEGDNLTYDSRRYFNYIELPTYMSSVAGRCHTILKVTLAHFHWRDNAHNYIALYKFESTMCLLNKTGSYHKQPTLSLALALMTVTRTFIFHSKQKITITFLIF